MTKQEAINYAKGMLKYGGNQRKQDFVSFAIECIEKQIPKKPLDARPPMHKDNVRCPNCRNTFSVVEKVAVVRHCHECGQAIDWSDNEWNI